MRLTPHEQELLLLSYAAQLARRRRARGLRLNHPEATGLTVTASTNTAAMSRQSNSRLPITLNTRDQPPAELPHQELSGLTGAVQC
jgi:urease gamma subunit